MELNHEIGPEVHKRSSSKSLHQGKSWPQKDECSRRVTQLWVQLPDGSTGSEWRALYDPFAIKVGFLETSRTTGYSCKSDHTPLMHTAPNNLTSTDVRVQLSEAYNNRGSIS
uniref:Uncharacterized protein n=1 Tax=Megaselia scalaris TaxID=36166 RepID=T1GYK4_MEGSC